MTNFPFSLFAVETSVSSKGELSATVAAAATTTLFLRKSSPAPLSAALTAKGTGGGGSLAKSSLTTALAKNVTNKAAPGPKVTAGTVHTAFPFTPTYMLARTAHSLSTHTAMQGASGSVSGLLSTTHLPKKPQAMHTGLPNPTRPDTPRASTPRPLTITAALTSLTASVKATRLPSLQTGNTDAAFPAVSTAMVTTGRMASNLDCQMSHKFLVKTGERSLSYCSEDKGAVLTQRCDRKSSLRSVRVNQERSRPPFPRGIWPCLETR